MLKIMLILHASCKVSFSTYLKWKTCRRSSGEVWSTCGRRKVFRQCVKGEIGCFWGWLGKLKCEGKLLHDYNTGNKGDCMHQKVSSATEKSTMADLSFLKASWGWIAKSLPPKLNAQQQQKVQCINNCRKITTTYSTFQLLNCHIHKQTYLCTYSRVFEFLGLL